MTADGPAMPGALRYDLQLIADMIAPGSRVLDIGCGDGALLSFLTNEKSVDGRGMEISQDGVNVCVSDGLSVIQGDADTDLGDYPSDTFAYVVLSKTLQATRNPRGVLQDLVRIARFAVVSFVNFGHWRIRWKLFAEGRMPATAGSKHSWHDSPDIHLCTIRDFVELCGEAGLAIERGISIDRRGHAFRTIGRLANWRDEQAVFLLRRG